MRHRAWVGVAALSGLIAVAAGAFAAHGLEARGDPRAAGWVDTGARHQMWHALAILAYLALGRTSALPLWLWAIGSILFASSLYALALGAPTSVAALAPVGGTAMIGGWAAVGWSALKERS
jgi:uncharacterized membrane protein YgdD (TMEM256/DUF423 family)